MTTSLLNRVAGNYAAWHVVPADYTAFADLVRWAVLAPSVHNTQPWVFLAEPDALLLAPDPERALRRFDPTQRQMYLSLGAALANLQVAARYFGWRPRPEPRLDPATGLLATRLELESGWRPSPEDIALFEAIPRRTTHRAAHRAWPLPASLRATLASVAAARALGFVVIEDGPRKQAVARLVYEADGAWFGDPGFACELSLWLRPNATTEYDGMPGAGFGIPDFPSRILPKVARAGLLGADIAARERRLLEAETSAVGILAAPEDTPAWWLTTGEALQLMALHATAAGLAVHVLAVVIEHEASRRQLRELVGTALQPQVLFRLGYPVVAAPATPRRPAAHVLAVGPGPDRRPIAQDRPWVLRLRDGSYTLDDLRRDVGEVTVIDRYRDEWLAELFTIRHPATNFNSPAGQAFLREHVLARARPDDGVWVYFPWRQAVTHLLERDEFLELLYSRNVPSIEPEAQARLAELRVGIVGLSIGSNIARALVMTGVQHLRIADFDTIAPSNSNRIGAGSVLNVGENKASALARELYEFNPYIDLRTYPDGIHEANLAEFMAGLDIVIDHMSDAPMKVRLRERARRNGTIVLMASNTWLSPSFDIELPDDPALFGGRVSRDTLQLMQAPSRTFPELARIASQIFVLEEMPASLIQNFLDILRARQNYGSQLGLAGLAVAAQVAYFVYEIARGNARRLARFKRLHLEQPDLFDGAEAARAREAFKQAFQL